MAGPRQAPASPREPGDASTITAHVLSTRPALFTLDGVLSAADCEALIRQAEQIGFAEAPVTVGPNRFAMMPDLRNNTRVIVDDVAMAGRLWERVREHVPTTLERRTAVGLNERFRFYRYDPGQQFDWHRDGAFHRSADEGSLLTLIFYLNEGCRGGATEFLHVTDEAITIEPRRGAALLFSHPVMHRGAPVIAGRKYVLRTDVMYRR